jgi:hypothetical protein
MKSARGATVLIRFFTITLFMFVASCGSDKTFVLDNHDAPPSTNCLLTDERLMMKVIIGDLDWSDYIDLKNAKEIRNSKPTGQIRIPTINASCTAFLINENTIMTNNHCVPSDFYARGVRFFLRDDNESREDFYCEKLLVTNAFWDFSLLECDGSPGDRYGYIPLSLSIPSQNQDMYLVQENCDYLSQPRCVVHKYVARGIFHRVSPSSLSHDADTLGGSSGSPIFDQHTHELIGIHNAGRTSTGSMPAMNFGIPMHQIAKYLFDNYPEIKVTYSISIEDPIDDLIDDIVNDQIEDVIDRCYL